MKTIEQARQDRRELEALIFKNVREYEEKYGIQVIKIDVSKDIIDIDFTETTTGITIKLEL